MKLTSPSIDADDDRAVSPVIGVILMVAITVILAAVIGAFVLNLGNDIQNTAPQASIQAVDAGSNYNDSADYSGGEQTAFYINHQQGDGIQFQNLKIVITNEDGLQIGNLSSENNWGAEGDLNITVEEDLSGSFSTGDQLTINTTAPTALTDGTQYTFQFIDQNSGSTVGTSTATLQ